jgi:hypothetical protein
MSTRQPKDWTPERHEACKAREKAATKGPWIIVEASDDGGSIKYREPGRGLFSIARVQGWDRNLENLSFIAEARDDVPDMLAKIEALTAEVEYYKRRERDICDAIGGVGDGGRYRNDIIDALRNRLRPEGPLHEAVKRDIRQAMLNLCGSGVPEEGLAHMHADHAIGLLENQRAEWFTKGPKR